MPSGRNIPTELRHTVPTEQRRRVPTELRRTVPTELRRTVTTELRRRVPTELRRTVSSELRRTVQTELYFVLQLSYAAQYELTYAAPYTELHNLAKPHSVMACMYFLVAVPGLSCYKVRFSVYICLVSCSALTLDTCLWGAGRIEGTILKDT